MAEYRIYRIYYISRQLDPFPCSCSLLPLARWTESRKTVGVACVLDGRLRNVAALTKLCHLQEERIPTGQNKVRTYKYMYNVHQNIIIFLMHKNIKNIHVSI